MTDSNDRVGTEFGPYRIDALLGRGGMGEVYRAYDGAHEREVALKLLGGRTADDGTFAERFRRECQAVARLGEPHIIPIHDFGEIDGVLYLDMRLVDGQNLRESLNARGPLPAADATDLIGQVAAALDAAHNAGLVHRDVKPENILVTPEGFAYLVDFGVAFAAGDEQLTKTGMAIGSTAYIAPEQFDNAPVTAATDTYALAAVYFELLTGRPPHAGESVSAVIKSAVMADAPPVSAVNPAVPASLDPVVAGGLAKDPAARYATSGEFAAAARAALEGAGSDAPTAFVQAGPTAMIPAAGYAASGPSTTAYPVTGSQYGQVSGPQAYSGAPQYSGPQYSGPQYSGPQQFSGPQYAPAPVAAADDNGGRGLQMALAGLIGLLVAGLIGLGIWYFLFNGKGGSDAAPTTTVTSTLASPPPGSVECAPGVGRGTGVTTCPFAVNVQQAYLQAGPMGEARTIQAYSPATGNSYSMSCSPNAYGGVTCTGGNNAVVNLY
ncbi:MAG: protein kinase [Gordonia sp. (in: high G+C Gram-positive bacteria)]|uniref:protein kinase domain-containing protein n=1 Tax=Gordonia sp. (in: high G+C Gram-positive bacteria) TaxID=84139 RepID=UPI0039E6B91A